MTLISWVLLVLLVVLFLVVLAQRRVNNINYKLALKYMALWEDRSNVFCLCCDKGTQVLGPEDFEDMDVAVRNGHVYKR